MWCNITANRCRILLTESGYLHHFATISFMIYEGGLAGPSLPRCRPTQTRRLGTCALYQVWVETLDQVCRGNYQGDSH